MGPEPRGAIAGLGLAMLPEVMERGTTHLGSQRDATAATDTMRLEARVKARFMVLIRSLQVESVPRSLLGRQIIPAAITSLEINPGWLYESQIRCAAP